MFTPLSMGTNHMLGQDNLVPITSNTFELRLFQLDGSQPAEANIMTLYTDEIGDIQEEQDIISVHYANGVQKFPAKVTFADIDWTLNYFCSPDVSQAIHEWRDQVYNGISERMGLPSEYMRNAYFIRYDGQGNPRKIIYLPCVWPGPVRETGGNQQGGEIVKISFPLVVSRMQYIKPEDYRG